MLKSKIGDRVQEVILPDFPDDDNTVTTVTKSRRVSFGTNFVKEFIVGSAVSGECMPEYEQAFPSSDSSNADSSHSGADSRIMEHSMFVSHDGHKAHKSVPPVGQLGEPDFAESRPKPPKFSSTVCFSADSPTTDMEFTEGCLTLAKSILDKKNKEMRVIIQGKPKDEEKAKMEETKYLNGSQFEMSMTKCLKSKGNKREEKRFEIENEMNIFHKYENEMSITRCSRIFNDDSDESWEECKENRMPLDMIMRHLDKDHSDFENDLFNPEKTFSGNFLNSDSLDFSTSEMGMDEIEEAEIYAEPNPIFPNHRLRESTCAGEKVEVEMEMEMEVEVEKEVQKEMEVEVEKKEVGVGAEVELDKKVGAKEEMEVEEDKNNVVEMEKEEEEEEKNKEVQMQKEVEEEKNNMVEMEKEEEEEQKNKEVEMQKEVEKEKNSVVEMQNVEEEKNKAVEMQKEVEEEKNNVVEMQNVEEEKNKAVEMQNVEEEKNKAVEMEKKVEGEKSKVAGAEKEEEDEENNVVEMEMEEETPEREPSLVDVKVIESLIEQSKEPGCVWCLKDLRHPQNKTQGWLLFHCKLLESSTEIRFALKLSNEDSLVACSLVTNGEVHLNEEKQFRLPEYRLVVDFGFDVLKTYFDEGRIKLETIRHVSYFLDEINSFMVKVNAYLRQIHSILTLYPGSRLEGSRLSFRLYSFPVFFSCVLSIDLSNLFRLSKSSLSFENDFGSLDENKIVDIFEECLKRDNSICEFVVQSTKYLFDLERKSGCVSKRGHIRLLPADLKL